MERQPYVRYMITADVTEKGTAYALKQAIMTYLVNHGLEGHISAFNPTSDRFEGVLELFPGGSMDLNMTALMKHIQTSGRLPTNRKAKPENINITPIPLDSTNYQSIIQNKPNNLEATLNGIYEENRVLKEELANSTKDAVNAREESAIARELYEGLEKKVSEMRISARSGLIYVIEGDPTTESAKKVLDKNTELYHKAQTKVIDELFRNVAAEVDKRRFYGAEESIKNANAIINDRDNYLKSFGSDSLSHLPQAAKEITEKIWSDAETIVKGHNAEIESVQTLKLPVYVAENGMNMYFSVPLLQGGKGEVTRAVGETLALFRKKVRGDNIRSSTEQTDYMFSMDLKIRNGRQDIRDSLNMDLNDALSGAKITPVFIDTEFVPGMYWNKTQTEESQKQTTANSIFEVAGKKVLQRINELGFKNVGEFIAKNGLGEEAVMRLIEGKFTRGPNARTIGPYSKALNWTKEEFRNLFDVQ